MITYRNLPRISNSDLSEFEAWLFGRTRFIPERAFAIGSLFHQVLLEGRTLPATGVSREEIALIRQLVHCTRSHAFCRWALQFSRKEQIYLWNEPENGQPCKAQIDCIWKGQTIVDFKTTSAPTYAAFLKAASRYKYDRQAAFYLDATGAKRFIFIGIQKVAPFEVFFFDATDASNFVETGRRKYQALLRQLYKTGYVPSSWVSVEYSRQVA